MLRLASAARRLSTSIGTTQKMSINGVGIHVVTNGKAPLPALLCMPGSLGTAETDFAPQLRDLADAFQVVSYDPRGYGQSRPPVRDFPVDFYQRDADDAAAVMRALGHDRYAVMGWSDGAIAAVKLAAANKHAVTKLVIFGGNAYMSANDAEAFESLRDISKWSKRMLETHLPVYGDDLQTMWSSATDGWLAIIAAGGDVCMEEARSIACPTLILHGAKDPLCLPHHPEWFAKNIPDARLHVFPDGKHNIHLKYADQVNDMAREFAGRE
jgi:valacyclovir hydrolase